jgi:hypothetical protein
MPCFDRPEKRAADNAAICPKQLRCGSMAIAIYTETLSR